VAVQVGDPATGLLDQDHRRSGIPRPEIDLDHRLRRSLGQQRVAPEVPEAALPPDVAEERPEARGSPGHLDVVAGAVQELGVG